MIDSTTGKIYFPEDEYETESRTLEENGYNNYDCDSMYN